jgi:predicted ATPase
MAKKNRSKNGRLSPGGVRIALRPALAATKGASAPEAGETIARARELAEQIDRPSDLAPLLFGQWSYHMTRAENKRALAVAEQLERTGELRNDIRAQLLGRLANGWTHLQIGEFVVARALLERCEGLAGAPRHWWGAV